VNLLEERWIPIRRASGLAERIAPHEIADRIDSDPVIALDAPRPDFNGALIQFLIGLVQTAWVRADQFWDRDEMLWSPPAPAELERMFAPLNEAFHLDGDRPRFMQDSETSPTGSENELRPIRALMIEAPGKDTLKENRDLFVKRGMVQAMCSHCAAAGLFTLQIHAPNGGRGHFPSLRKGGEITTLIAFTPNDATMTPALWRDIACNILEASSLRALCDPSKTQLKHCFPWLSTVDALQAASGQTWPRDVNPAHLFWPMPRRIRLDFDATTAGACDVCGADSTPVLTRYFTWPNGLNYNGESKTEKATRKQAGSGKKPKRMLFPNWQHPLSPHERAQTGNLLPLSLEEGGLSYRYWLGCALGVKRPGREVLPAAVVHAFRSSRVESGQLRLRAFGYDVDNMKARCWYETTFPLFDLASDTRSSQDLAEIISSIVDPLILAAETAATFLLDAVRDSRTKPAESHKRDRSWREAARRNVAFCEASFWSRTEGKFFALVEQAIAVARQHGRDGYEKSEPLRREWLRSLRNAAFGLFDEAAARGSIGAGDPSKLAAAYNKLREQLLGRQLQQALGLMSTAQVEAVSERGARRKKATLTTEAQ
jgi:CRISPR system Cascade subunit CasA